MSNYKVLFVLVFLLASVIAQNASTYYPASSALSISNSRTFPAEIEPDTAGATLQVDVINHGNAKYTNVKAVASFPDGFVAVKDTVELLEINPNDQYTLYFRFNVENVDPGIYSVPVTFYFTETNKGINVVSTRYVSMSVESSPRVEIDAIIMTPSISVGDLFTINVTLLNNGGFPAANVMTDLILNAPYINVLTSMPKRTAIIGAGSAAMVVIDGEVTPFADPGAYPAVVSVDYDGQQVNKSFVLQVASRAELDVSDVVTSIEPGKQADVGFIVTNRGQATFSDVKVSLLTNISLSIADNSLYLGNLRPGESRQVTFSVRADRALASGIYPMTIIIDAAEKSQREAAALVVDGIPDLRGAGVTTDVEQVISGKPFSVSIQLENIGTGSARSVRATLLEEKVIGIRESFMGTIDADDTDTAIFDLTTTKLGDNEFSVLVGYEDNNGNAYSKTVKAAVYVHAANNNLGVIAFLALAVAISYYIYRRKRKMDESKKKVR